MIFSLVNAGVNQRVQAPFTPSFTLAFVLPCQSFEQRALQGTRKLFVAGVGVGGVSGAPPVFWRHSPPQTSSSLLSSLRGLPQTLQRAPVGLGDSDQRFGRRDSLSVHNSWEIAMPIKFFGCAFIR